MGTLFSSGHRVIRELRNVKVTVTSLQRVISTQQPVTDEGLAVHRCLPSILSEMELGQKQPVTDEVTSAVRK